MTLEEYNNSDKSFESYKDELGIVMMPYAKVVRLEDEHGVILIKDMIPGGIYAVVSIILDDGDSFYHVPIHTALIEDCGLDIEEVIDLATKQMAERFPPKFIEAYKEIGVIPINKEDEGVYVLEAESGPFGTSCIMYDGMLEYIADKVGGDFYVIPSSTDWFTIIKKDGTASIEPMKELMIQHIIELGEEFFLSDNILYYDSAEKRLMLEDENKNSKVIYFNRTSEYNM